MKWSGVPVFFLLLLAADMLVAPAPAMAARSSGISGWSLLGVLGGLFVVCAILSSSSDKKEKVLRERYSAGYDDGAAKVRSELEGQVKRLKSEIEDERIRTQVRLEVEAKRNKEQLEAERRRIKNQEDVLARRRDEFEKIMEQKTIGFPWLAGKLAEIHTARLELAAEILETKRNPSIKGAEAVRKAAAEKRQALKETNTYRFQLEYYETLFPWLSEYREIPDDQIIKAVAEEEVDQDPAARLVTSAEWSSLSTTEKFQRALDRYIARRKSNWEIGRDYERYIGHRFEVAGYEVDYFGALQGLEDMGRDLVVRKDGATKIVQCKYWAQEKTIHEKHIFQLFGTAVMYAVGQIGMSAKGAFATLCEAQVSPTLFCSCSVSNLAREMAKGLGVSVHENTPFDREYSRIKCNIGKDCEKIYHLPFDQMYDRIKIEPHKNEFYAKTVEEAERQGFRRAWRWRGN